MAVSRFTRIGPGATVNVLKSQSLFLFVWDKFASALTFTRPMTITLTNALLGGTAEHCPLDCPDAERSWNENISGILVSCNHYGGIYLRICDQVFDL